MGRPRKDAPKKPLEGKKKRGRPSGYDPAYHPQQAFKFAVLGLNDDEMAAAFRVDVATFQRWKIDFPQFCDSIHAGKEPATSEVAHSLRQRALGFEWVEEVPQKIKEIKYDKLGKKIAETEKIIITKVKRIVPPDTQAASLYLRNRSPKHWRDQVHVEDAGKFSIAEEIRKAREILAKGSGDGADSKD